MHTLFLRIQPKWLNIPANYFEKMLKASGGRQGKELELFLKETVKQDFPCLGKRPGWLQEPQWPIVDGKPLVFVGQLDLGAMFHDTARVYVFVDPGTQRVSTVIQAA